VIIGALLGLAFGLGALLAVRAAPPMRPIRLAERIAPYLGDTQVRSRLLDQPSSAAAPFAVARRFLGPLVGDVVRFADRAIGGAASVRRRLRGLGMRTTVEEFRIEQVVWGAIGVVGGAGLMAAATATRGGADPVLTAGAGLGGAVAGALGRDWLLTTQLRHRERAMLAELPIVADLLALSVVAGEAPIDALQRVGRLTGGALAVMPRDVVTG